MSAVNKELLSDLGISDAEDIDLEENNEGSEDEESLTPEKNEESPIEKGNEESNKNEQSNEEDMDVEGENPCDISDASPKDQGQEASKKKSKKSIKLSEKEKAKMKKKVEEFNLKQMRKGVCYLSRIPPYMKVTYIRKLLESYGVERIYLAPEEERKRKFRVRNGGNKKRCYTEGWVEFTDKRVAKRVAMSLNCSKMVQKTKSFYGEDLWNIKYLPKFKWDNLTERITYQNRVRKEKLQIELNSSRKEQDFYRKQLDQSKKIQAVEKRRADKNQPKIENIARRTFIQREPTKKVHLAQSEEGEDE